MSQITDVPVNVASLYVGDLKPEVTEQTLWTVFNAYGQILSVKICRDSTTRQSLGYGYVNFRSTAEADKAMRALNFTPIDDKPCRIMWSMRDPQRRKSGQGNLFLKNIDLSVDSKALYEAFVVFGPIMSCKLATDDYGNSKGYGFIQFYNEKHAEEALGKANGVEFLSKRLIVNKFLTKAQRAEIIGDRVPAYTNVFVKNFKQEWTLDELKQQFEKFGQITSCIIQKDDSGNSLGFGFVNFANSADALKAVEGMKEFKLPSGNLLYVDRAQKKSERMAMLRSQYEKKKLETYRKYQSLNLYVKNFDDSMTDEKLGKEFSQYGAIQSAHIMKDEHGKSKGFGFVCFVNSDDAQKALNEMAGKLIDDKPLYVAYAQSREERRKAMEQRNLNQPFRGQFAAPLPIMYPGAPPATAYAMPAFQGRLPQMQGVVGGRMAPRHNQPVGNAAHHVYQPLRTPYVYPPNSSFGQPNYRPRVVGGAHQQMNPQNKGMMAGGNSMPRQQYQNVMQNAYMGQVVPPGYVPIPNPNMARPIHNTAAMNIVSSADAGTERSFPPIDVNSLNNTGDDGASKFGDKVFRLCQKAYPDYQENLTILMKIAGVVVDCLRKDRAQHHTEEDLLAIIRQAHHRVVTQAQQEQAQAQTQSQAQAQAPTPVQTQAQSNVVSSATSQ